MIRASLSHIIAPHVYKYIHIYFLVPDDGALLPSSSCVCWRISSHRVVVAHCTHTILPVIYLFTHNAHTQSVIRRENSAPTEEKKNNKQTHDASALVCSLSVRAALGVNQSSARYTAQYGKTATDGDGNQRIGCPVCQTHTPQKRRQRLVLWFRAGL